MRIADRAMLLVLALTLMTCPTPLWAADADTDAAEATATRDDAEKVTEAREGDAADPPADAIYRRQAREIIVTALRGDSDWFDTPNTVDTISSDDIQVRKMSRTLPDALSETPGIMLQKTTHGHGSPYIRGFTSFRNLLLIDGIRLNNSVFRPGPNQYWNTVDQFVADRLEVVKGPSSVLYGSDAIGGVVNVITRAPEGTEPYCDKRVYYRYSTAENSHTVRGEVLSVFDKQWSAMVGATFKQFGNLDGGDDVGRQDRTGYDEFDGDVKLIYRSSPDQYWVFAHQHVDQNDVWRTHKTIFGISWHGTTVGNDLARIYDQNRDLTYVQYHATDLGGAVDAVHASLSYHLQSEDYTRIRNNGRYEDQGFDAHTLGAWLQLESPSPVGHWTYGAEFYKDFVETFRTEWNADGSVRANHVQGPVADNSTYSLFGLFAQNAIPVAPQADLILGVRYTHASVTADSVEDPATGEAFSLNDHWDSVVGSARGVWRLDEDEHWALFGGVSQGFRAPNLSDLTRYDTARTNEVETPSPGLDPEHFIQYEIGLKGEAEDASMQLAWFFTDIRDMIVRTPTGAVIGADNEVTKQNAGDGYVHGVELQGSWQFHEQLTAFGGFWYTDGAVDTYPTPAPIKVRESIDRNMPTSGYLGIRWDSTDRKFWAEAVGTFVGAANELSTRDAADTQRIPPGGTPGYQTLDLRGGWNVNECLSVFANLENVTNEDYRVHGSGVNAAGINLIVGMDARF